jgi:hypothetical protein
MSEPRMHYYPAALIGEFGEANSKKSGRNRPVWMARRSAPRVFRQAAEAGGWDPQNAQLYHTPDGVEAPDLDELWLASERRFGGLRNIADGAARTGCVPAQAFINVLVPFVAHLLARHPELGLLKYSRLSADSPRQEQELRGRWEAFATFLDALAHHRAWSLLEVPESTYLVSTDIGWHLFPGPAPGELFVPLSPRRALIITGGTASYTHGDDWVEIPTLSWADENVEMKRDVMVLAAPREVYADTEDRAEQARALWDHPAPHSPSGIDLTVMAMNPAANWAYLLTWGGATNADFAWARFMVESHRWGCHCEEKMKANGIPRAERRTRIRYQRLILKKAEQSLRVSLQ